VLNGLAAEARRGRFVTAQDAEVLSADIAARVLLERRIGNFYLGRILRVYCECVPSACARNGHGTALVEEGEISAEGRAG
jgi:hypothetical protein